MDNRQILLSKGKVDMYAIIVKYYSLSGLSEYVKPWNHGSDCRRGISSI